MECGVGNWTGPLPGDPDNNVVLSAVPAFGGIDVSWTYPLTNPEAVAHVLLFRNTSPSLGGAVQRAVVSGSFFYDKLDTGTTYYYWIQIVSVHGTVGDPVGPASAEARPLIADLIEQLTGQIDRGVLANALKTELDQISALNTNLANEIFDRETGQTSFAEALIQVEDGVADAMTFINSEINSRVTATSALAEAIDLVSVTLGSDIAAVTVLANAWITPLGVTNSNLATTDGKVADIGALYTVKVTVNGLVGGFGIYNDGTTIEAGFDVDTFWVGKTNANKRKPFIIVGGETFIDQAVINQLTFTKLRDEAGSFIVSGGRVQADYISVNTASIQNASVTTAKIVDAAITTAKIDNLAVTSAKIENLAVTSAKIENLAVTSAKIADLAVDTIKIAGNSISRSHFGAGTINVTVGPIDTFGRVHITLSGDSVGSGNPLILRRDGVTLLSHEPALAQGYTFAYVDTPPPGPHTYVGTGSTASFLMMTILDVQK